MKKITLLIPVFNNADALELLYNEVNKIALSEAQITLLFVDDGSKDDSLSIIKHLAASDDKVKYIALRRNFGQVAAVEAGLASIEADAIVVKSADLQESVHLIPKMVEYWQHGSEVVVAHRYKRHDALLDRIVSQFFYFLIKRTLPDMPSGGFDYFLLDQQVVHEIRQMNYRNRFLQGDILHYGFETSLIPVQRRADSRKRRGIKNLPFKIKYFIDGVLHSSVLPIRIISILGFITTTLACLYSIAIIIEWYYGNMPFKGWAPIMISIMFIGGIILLTLGVLGEYIWRIYDEVKGFPKYSIKKSNYFKSK